MEKNKLLVKSIFAIAILVLFLQGCASSYYLSGYRQMAEKSKEVTFDAKYYCGMSANRLAIYGSRLAMTGFQDKGRLYAKGGFSNKQREKTRNGLEGEFVSLAQDCIIDYKEHWAQRQASLAANYVHACLDFERMTGVVIILFSPIIAYCTINVGAPTVHFLSTDYIR